MPQFPGRRPARVISSPRWRAVGDVTEARLDRHASACRVWQGCREARRWSRSGWPTSADGIHRARRLTPFVVARTDESGASTTERRGRHHRRQSADLLGSPCEVHAKVTRGELTAARMCSSAHRRRHRRSLVAATLIVAFSGAVFLAAVAGARRSDSAFERMKDKTRAAQLRVFGPAIDDATLDGLRALPGVVAVGRARSIGRQRQRGVPVVRCRRRQSPGSDHRGGAAARRTAAASGRG